MPFGIAVAGCGGLDTIHTKWQRLLGEQHLTRVQLYPAVGCHRLEYVFPGGLSTVECDDLCLHVIGEDEDTDQKQELLVTSTLASVLHANGVSLENHVVDFTCGRASRVEEITLIEVDGEYFTGFAPICIVPASLPATLSAAVRARGWQKTVEWLRDTQTMLEQHLDEIRMELAVWVPASAPDCPESRSFFSIVSARDTSGLRRRRGIRIHRASYGTGGFRSRAC